LGERVDRDGVFISRRGPGEGLLSKAIRKPLTAVILSEAKNLSSCSFDELQRSLVAFGSSG
jgi:hypothetical protein